MSKFNKNATDKVVNKSGHAAYKMSDKAKLVAMTLTSFFGEQKYYGDNTSELVTLAAKLAAEQPAFVANLARYARKEMHLRSVSHALAVIVANVEESKPYIRAVVNDVVERPDDITEILALQLAAYGKPIPNGLKKALGDALCRFDMYAISKYSGGNKSVKFIDVLRLTHAEPKTPEQQALFSAIVTDTLPAAERWETELSASGNTKEVWEKLIADKKLGYMAALRNLRNMVSCGPDNLGDVLAFISDRDATLKSKQLPMRFYAAYRELQEYAKSAPVSSKVFDAIETAIEHSVENLPKLPGKTVIAVDSSASMGMAVSERSSLSCFDIAAVLAGAATHICEDFLIYSFDTEIRAVPVSGKNGIIATAKSIDKLGGGTDINLPFEKMIEDKVYADRVILLSDNEINHGYYGFSRTVQATVDKYRNAINPELWVHAIDIVGYGTQQFRGKNTNIIAGWGDRVLEFILLAEQGMDTQVKLIENYK